MPCSISISAGVRLLVAGAMLLQAGSAIACSTTPAEAVRAFEQGGLDRELGSGDGYRVAALYRDTVLGRDWASVERCGHPEWPRVSVAQPRVLGGINAVVAASSQSGLPRLEVRRGLPIVRAGETVRLWRQETNMRMEVAAVSEESGAVGDRIRLRFVGRAQEGELPRTIVGLVRGPADVEME